MAAPVTLGQVIDFVTSRTEEAPPLERLSLAVRLGEELSGVGDALVGHFVDAARASGCSWREIGESLGVSKQAAQQKFVSRSDFTLWTPRARNALLEAERYARALRHNHIATEHLLVAIASDPDGVAAHMLARAEVTAEDLKAAVEERVEMGSVEPKGHALPLTPKAKAVVQLAFDEAIGLGHNYIGTEHVLLGLAKGEGMATEILKERGVELEALRAAAVELLSGLAPGGRRKQSG